MSARTRAHTCAAFGYQGRASRSGFARFNDGPIIGAELKQAVKEPGEWTLNASSFGEILPNHLNQASIDRSRKDKYGLPVLKIDAVLRENELAMQKDMVNDAVEMFEAAGYKDIKISNDVYYPGSRFTKPARRVWARTRRPRC